MDINLVFRIAGLGIIIAILNIVLKKSDREDVAMMTTLVGVVIICIMVINLISKLFDSVKTMLMF